MTVLIVPNNTQFQSLLDELRTGLKRLYQDRLLQVLLYGSHARGEATEQSDVDVMVVLAGPVVPGREIDKMLNLIVEINEKYRTLISVYPVSLEDYRSIQSPLLINARREAVEI